MKSNSISLVFIHYFGGDAGSWQWISKRLKKKYNCIFLTLPGFNNTTPLEDHSIRMFSEWIANEIEALNINNYILIGHSMGGKLALFTTFILHNLLPKKIILIAPSPPAIENMPEEEKKRMLNHPDRKEAIITVERAVEKKIKQIKFNYAVDSQLRINPETWNWWITKGMKNDISWAVKNLEVETFIICSKKDSVITLDAIHNEILPFIKNARLITFGRSGHLIPLESSRKLAKVIIRIAKK